MTAKSNEIFQRIEKKYLLNKRQYRAIRMMMEPFIREDEYGLSTICNVYYDTTNYELIRRSIEKPVYKEKLRVRSYGTPGENDDVFIEIKKKFDSVVYKRRIQLPLKEARNYLNHGIKPKSQVNPQILSEIDYFMQYYEPIPKMYIAYDRIATYGIDDNSIRITFDANIRAREYETDLAAGDEGGRLFAEEEVLMEIKVGGAYPLWMTEILSALEVYPVSFSKYGSFYKQSMREEQEEKERKIICLPA